MSPRVRYFAFLELPTLEPERVGAGDIAVLRAAGLSHAAIEDAIYVCSLFNLCNRVADSQAFQIPDPRGFAFFAGIMLRYGYD